MSSITNMLCCHNFIPLFVRTNGQSLLTFSFLKTNLHTSPTLLSMQVDLFYPNLYSFLINPILRNLTSINMA
ncbi:hypothetical protein CW304_18905 [Bacillus sp. UFRGS-B20]|nr:hypothetical protein CW304_18905 [Bacillus sp. UFRGS-B20]